MTLEEMRALKAGDEVYYVTGSNWELNAIVRGHGARLAKWLVSRAPGRSAKTMHIGSGRYSPGDLLTIADGEAAMAAFELQKREREAMDRRWAAVRDRLQAATGGAFADAFSVRDGSSISLACRGIDKAERVAAAMEVGVAALRLQGDIMALADSDAPAVHLHLSVAQAERVLTTLRGTP